jgi:hypothetical protein
MKRITITIVIIAVATALVGFTVSPQVYAQLVKDPGASFFAPEEEPQLHGWDPHRAEEYAPGEFIEGQHCIGCVTDFAAGQEALTSGIIEPH